MMALQETSGPPSWLEEDLRKTYSETGDSSEGASGAAVGFVCCFPMGLKPFAVPRTRLSYFSYSHRAEQLSFPESESGSPAGP